MQDNVRFKWPNPFESETVDEDREIYKIGDSLLVFDEVDEQVRSFTVPYSMTGNFCQIRNPIKYLEPLESSCLRTEMEHLVFRRAYKTQLLNTKILSTRRGIGNHAMMAEYCTSDIALTTSINSHRNCIPIQVFECVETVTATKCHKFNETEYSFDENTPNGRIIIDIIHNFTNILNSSVYFMYEDSNDMVNKEISAKRNTIEKVIVRFKQVNETLYGHRVSGNIGYKLGEPIIVSRYVPYNVSVPDTSILDYFHENRTSRSFLRLPKFLQNICELNNLTYEPINFGHDLYIKCDVMLDEDSLPAISTESNFTDVCLTFQKRIFFYLINGLEQKENETKFTDVVVSEFGNPVNMSKHWGTIDLNVDEEHQILGHFDKDESEVEFTCRNMVLNVKYEFMYGRITVGTVKHQFIVRQSRITFGTRLDLKFRIGEEMKVPTFLDVMFYDLTNVASNRIKFLLFSPVVVLFKFFMYDIGFIL